MFTGKIIKLFLAIAMMFTVSSLQAGIISYERDVDYAGQLRFDRYLDIEIWVDDDDYYQGDDIKISFEANKNCYVAIYNIDSKGEINLIFPTGPGDNNWIKGGRVYNIPDRYDDFNLTVQGPEGVEYLQIIASMEPIRVPDWFEGSGFASDDDPYDFLDFINATYFGCDNNCPRAFDLTSFVVKEWQDYYFRPVHHHHYDYWDWDYCGSVYIDYPFGATIYIDGVYWGIAPLFIPRIYFGWHYVTIYDHYGYCWEDRINFVRNHSIVLDRTIVRPKAEIRSRFKEVHAKAYLNPVNNGYPNYKAEIKTKQTYKPVATRVGEGRVKYAIEKSAKSIRQNKVNSSQRTYDRQSTYKRGATKNQNREERGTSWKSSESSKRSTKAQKDYRRKSSDSKRSSGRKSSDEYKRGKSSDSQKSGKARSKPTSGEVKSKSTTTKQSSGSVKSSSGSRQKSTTKSSGTKSSGSSSRSGKRGR